MYTNVAYYKSKHGYNVTAPFSGNDGLHEIIEDVSDLSTLKIENVDPDEIMDEFLNWFNKVTCCRWHIEEIGIKDVDNWMRYQDVDYWKYLTVLEVLKDYQEE